MNGTLLYWLIEILIACITIWRTLRAPIRVLHFPFRSQRAFYSLLTPFTTLFIPLGRDPRRFALAQALPSLFTLTQFTSDARRGRVQITISSIHPLLVIFSICPLDPLELRFGKVHLFSSEINIRTSNFFLW